MSSTAEELSSQSEQLQEMIAYFKVEAARQRASLRPAAQVSPGAAGAVAGSLKIAHLSPQSKADGVVKSGKPQEVALNLGSLCGQEAGDSLDAEFEKY